MHPRALLTRIKPVSKRAIAAHFDRNRFFIYSIKTREARGELISAGTCIQRGLQPEVFFGLQLDESLLRCVNNLPLNVLLFISSIFVNLKSSMSA